MAQSDPSRTEKATPKRRKKTREEGNVPKSQDLTRTATVFAGILGLYIYFPVIVEQVRQLFRYFMMNAATYEVTPGSAYALLLMAMGKFAIMVLPVLLLVAFTAILILRRQVGALWTTKVFKFKWSNFNLLNGLKRMFASPQTLVRLFKSAAIALVIGLIPYFFLKNEFETFVQMYHADAEMLGVYMLKTGFKLMMYTLAPMGIIGLADVLYSFWRYEESIKMTKEEVKDEQKQAEGDPKMKAKQRQKMMQMMMNRMMKEVPKADLVVTNPTHYAVALRYDPTISPAPLVVAKGMNKVAEKIKTIAREHRVPIRENRLLARSLYRQVEIGQPIPEELYKAVAALLAEIWKLQGKIPSQ